MPIRLVFIPWVFILYSVDFLQEDFVLLVLLGGAGRNINKPGPTSFFIIHQVLHCIIRYMTLGCPVKIACILIFSAFLNSPPELKFSCEARGIYSGQPENFPPP